MILSDTLNEYNQNSEKYLIKQKELNELLDIFDNILRPYEITRKTLPEWWLFAKQKAIEAAAILYVLELTKQLCNRLFRTLYVAYGFSNFDRI